MDKLQSPIKIINEFEFSNGKLITAEFTDISVHDKLQRFRWYLIYDGNRYELKLKSEIGSVKYLSVVMNEIKQYIEFNISNLGLSLELGSCFKRGWVCTESKTKNSIEIIGNFTFGRGRLFEVKFNDILDDNKSSCYQWYLIYDGNMCDLEFKDQSDNIRTLSTTIKDIKHYITFNMSDLSLTIETDISKNTYYRYVFECKREYSTQ